MVTFSALLAIRSEDSPVNGEFPALCAWISGWINNREDGDLRRYRAHYDVTVMGECDPVSMQLQMASDSCHCPLITMSIAEVGKFSRHGTDIL